MDPSAVNPRGEDATPEPPHNNQVEASFLIEVEVLQDITLVPVIVADISPW
jgi:hypothetical protein